MPTPKYAFTSEQDFFDRTGHSNFADVAEIDPGGSTTSRYYKEKGTPQVYEQDFSSTSGGGNQSLESYVKQFETPNLQSLIGTRPSAVNPSVTEYFDKAAGTGFGDEKATMAFATQKTGKNFANWGEFNTAYTTPPTAPPAKPPVNPLKLNPPVQTSDAERARLRQEKIDQIKSELEAGTAAPTPFKSSEEYVKLRQEQGVVKDEEELSALRNEANLIKQEIRQFSTKAGEGVSEGGRIGAMSEAERNANFRLEGLAIQEQAALSRLNSKNAYIGTVLGLGAADYQTARQEYEFAYNQNLNATNLYNQELATEKQDALAGLTTITNLLKGKNIDWANMDSSITAQLDTLSLQAGLPTGMLQEILMAPAEQEIAHIQTNKDGTTSVFYKQGGQISGFETYGEPQAPETDYQFSIAPDGTPIIFDANSGQLSVLPGNFADPKDDPSNKWLNTPLSTEDLKAYPGLPAGTTWNDVVQQGLTPTTPPNADNLKAAGYAERVQNSLNTFEKSFELFAPGRVYGGAGGSFNLAIDKKKPYSLQPSYLKQHEQAAKNFINAVLRRESGATIIDDEYRRAEQQYMPKPGDGPEVLAQKFNDMRTALSNFIRESGSAWAADSLFKQFEDSGGKASSGSTPYLKTLGAVTGPNGSPVWKWGLDVDLKKGQPVVSPVSGTVTFAATNGGFGKQVKIRSSDGREIWLSHFDALNVKAGQQIKAGQVIALGGNSGKVIAVGGGDGSHVDITMPKPGGGYYTAPEVQKYLSNLLV